MKRSRIALAGLGFAVLFAGCGDRNGDSVNAGRGDGAAAQPSVPPQEGGHAVTEPTIPPEEGGAAAQAGRASVGAEPSPPDPRAVPAPRPTAVPSSATPSDGNVSSMPQAGSTATTVVAGAGQGPGVFGRVTTAGTGSPVAGAAVEASSPSQPSALVAAVTDADGRYVWPLAPGTWEVSVSAAGHRPATRSVVVGPGPMMAVDVALERA